MLQLDFCCDRDFVDWKREIYFFYTRFSNVALLDALSLLQLMRMRLIRIYLTRMRQTHIRL